MDYFDIKIFDMGKEYSNILLFCLGVIVGGFGLAFVWVISKHKKEKKDQ